ncbi:metallophosphoesterase [Paenibacillus periandrae]|uniref:metallophosphoesterase n=1 Tax=Paenibacillus periandrae TaxID=1761741 RepID=UPI001F09D72E|nr:metallophosphoesterase [Paenibacillus periandrae]
MQTFDLISDIHLEFWIPFIQNVDRMRSQIDSFIDDILPDKPSKVLVIAGDLGHYNEQNILMLTSFRRYYEYVLFTFGNHDLYMISSAQRERYNNSSINRWGEMKQHAAEIPGVFPLDGNLMEIEGVTFGGTGMWYDYSFGIQELGMTKARLHKLWKQAMNDVNYIIESPIFLQEEEKLSKVFKQCNVVVTHVGPDWSNVHGKYRIDPITSFFYFDGSKWLSQARGKIWCYGHTHSSNDYAIEGCRLVNNALGYPNENPFSKLVSIEIVQV